MADLNVPCLAKVIGYDKLKRNYKQYKDKKELFQDFAVVVDDLAIRAEHIIVATGSSASVPPIAGMESVPYLTSTTALELEELPASLLVVGGGYVGCELAQMFARAGVDITIRRCDAGDAVRRHRR